MDRLREAPVDAGTSTSAGQQRPKTKRNLVQPTPLCVWMSSAVDADFEINFDHPSEYLVQVEGSYSAPVNFLRRVLSLFLEGSPSRSDSPFAHVSSLSFITTKRKYGLYGTPHGPTTPFCSDPGRVVGFYAEGRLRTLQVHVIPGNIVGCLRKFLDEEIQSA